MGGGGGGGGLSAADKLVLLIQSKVFTVPSMSVCAVPVSSILFASVCRHVHCKL